jgi:hypothetical protein
MRIKYPEPQCPRLARLRELVKRPAIIAAFALLVVPTIASANCPTPTKPPHCWEAGIEPTSGACGRYLKEREEETSLYEQCLQSEREIQERGERERAEANRKYEERLHEIAEEQKRYEQQQAEAKYAREHPTPPPAPPPAPAPTPPSITAFASSSSVKLSSGIGTITAGCGAASNETCIFALTLVATVHGAHASAVKHVTVGTVTGNVQGGKSGKLTVKLNSRGRGYLKHNSLHLEATGAVKCTAGLVTKISRHLTIKKK